MKMCYFQSLSFSLYELNSAGQNADQVKGYDPKDNQKIKEEAQTFPEGNVEWSE